MHDNRAYVVEMRPVNITIFIKSKIKNQIKIDFLNFYQLHTHKKQKTKQK